MAHVHTARTQQQLQQQWVQGTRARRHGAAHLLKVFVATDELVAETEPVTEADPVDELLPDMDLVAAEERELEDDLDAPGDRVADEERDADPLGCALTTASTANIAATMARDKSKTKTSSCFYNMVTRRKAWVTTGKSNLGSSNVPW